MTTTATTTPQAQQDEDEEDNSHNHNASLQRYELDLSASFLPEEEEEEDALTEGPATAGSTTRTTSNSTTSIRSILKPRVSIEWANDQDLIGEIHGSDNDHNIDNDNGSTNRAQRSETSSTQHLLPLPDHLRGNADTIAISDKSKNKSKTHPSDNQSRSSGSSSSISFWDNEDDDNNNNNERHRRRRHDYHHSDADSDGSTDPTHQQQQPSHQHLTAAQQIARAESRAVERARAGFVLVLVSTTLLLAQAVYFWVDWDEIQQFHGAYEDQAQKIGQAVGLELDTTLASIDNLVDTLQSEHYAASRSSRSRRWIDDGNNNNNNNTTQPTNDKDKDKEDDWPFVAISDFAVRAEKLRRLNRATSLTLCPKVSAGPQRRAWEYEWAPAHSGAWVTEGLQIQREQQQQGDANHNSPTTTSPSSEPLIHDLDGQPLPATAVGPHFPTYYSSPVVGEPPYYNWDLFVPGAFSRDAIEEMQTKYVVTLGEDNTHNNDDDDEPAMMLFYPIVQNAHRYVDAATLLQEEEPDDRQVVGTVAVTLLWRDLMSDILRPGESGMVAVIGNDCPQQLQTFTYELKGPTAKFLGYGDRHDLGYDDNADLESFRYLHELTTTNSGNSSSNSNRTTINNNQNQYTGFPLTTKFCNYWIALHASDEMSGNYRTNNPLISLCITVVVFLVAACMFTLYDWVIEYRQKKVLRVATQSSAIVASIFPKVVRDRLFPVGGPDRNRSSDELGVSSHAMIKVENAKMRVKNFIDHNKKRSRRGSNASQESMVNSGVEPAVQAEPGIIPGVDPNNAPIAELFTDTTVLFADIAGFTAWSSVREPSQVFTLLETLYGAFDRIASKRGVFKVETIGDSYLAVTGLPDPRADHALVMAKFARDIRNRMSALTLKLARSLGPDTDNLQLRIGMNSGPVTAGVLRGEKSRFQLFGDTVNTASRMESTGVVSKIQASSTTAELLKKAGKSHWLTKREDKVEAKGKGVLQTYFIEPGSRPGASNASTVSSIMSEDDDDFEELDEKTRRLVDWNVEIMTKLIKQIVARREARSSISFNMWLTKGLPGRLSRASSAMNLVEQPKAGTVIDEVQEVVELPAFDPRLNLNARDPTTIELSAMVLTQLREYVSLIALMYKNNPFHCFEHASHVTMSVVKLMSRIVAPSDAVIRNTKDGTAEYAVNLHDHTYGITSDPLTQFACIFSALIHDVDHQGVSNAQLVAEGSPLGQKYSCSLAEQNSVDLSWKLLMDDQFEDLRHIICETQEEMTHFRHLVVNCVLATDIMDKDLIALRNKRWETAFSENSANTKTNVDRKATIVIEHLIQASDVAHTMQHWHIYRKWNQKLFGELYQAYKNGRSEKNPADFWYKGEMGFFDFYVIPLAKKLSDCGVFGVASDEYLNYAMKNREEWERKGQEIVATMLQELDEKKDVDDNNATEGNDTDFDDADF